MTSISGLGPCNPSELPFSSPSSAMGEEESELLDFPSMPIAEEKIKELSLNSEELIRVNSLKTKLKEINTFFHSKNKRNASKKMRDLKLQEYGIDDYGIVNLLSADIERMPVGKFNSHMEEILVRFVERMLYMQEIKEDLTNNKDEIINIFFNENNNVHKANISFTFTFNLEPDSNKSRKVNELHNGGKTPVIVTYFHKNQEMGKVVYKPRGAEVDKAVIDTFDKINKDNFAKKHDLVSQLKMLNSDYNRLKEKERDYLNKNEFVQKLQWAQFDCLKVEHEIKLIETTVLPVYEILTIYNKKRSASVWKFIKGSTLKNLNCNYASEYVQRNIQDSQKKNAAQARLDKMDAVLTAMQIGDLHNENIIIIEEKDEGTWFIPIDLENHQPHERTLLRPLNNKIPQSIKLTENEQKLIKEFNKSVKNFPVRILLIGTRDLAIKMYNPMDQSDLLIRAMEKAVEEKGFKITISTEDLKKLFTRGVLSGDIPFFTEIESVLYYGSECNPLTKMGEKKSMEKKEEAS